MIGAISGHLRGGRLVYAPQGSLATGDSMNTAPLSHLGHLDIATFLRDYWHKKPVLLRNALPDFQPLISGDELAGLACEEGVEARLIIAEQPGHDWSLEHGPFDETRFSSLPANQWTLLVQAVDHWLPEAADFLQQFRFIPNWRLDDLMISYAADGGGVGPHFDNYDVFLVQAEGRRRWEIGGHFNSHTPLRSGLPVKILQQWQPEQVFELEPGDILYVPPCVGHNGIALGDGCITYSVGFRAPSLQEVLRDFSDYVGERLLPEVRYADADLHLPQASAQIDEAAIERLRQLLHSVVDNREYLAQWLGKYMTEPKYDEHDPAPEESFSAQEWPEVLQQQSRIRLNESSRYAWTEVGDGGLTLFVDGAAIPCPPPAAAGVKRLCESNEVDLAQLPGLDEPALQAMLLVLYNQGSLYFVD